MPVPVVTKMLTTLEYAYRNDEANARLTNEVYADILQLFNSFGVDALRVAGEAVAWVKRPAHRAVAVAALARPPASPASRPASPRAAPSRSRGTGSSARTG